MASVLFTIGGAVVNALAFSSTNFVYSRLTNHDVEERKRHDSAEEKLQRARNEWNRDRMKRLEARAYLKNVDEAMLVYYRVFAKKKSLCHLSLSYQIFIILRRFKKMVNYYLL